MLPTQEDETFLRHCLALARKGLQSVSPNPAVGSLIVRDGEIVSEGWHIMPGEDHAERNAIKKAAGKTDGATLYVNLEPCCHWGRTPPCTDAILEAGIRKVVACTIDPNPKVNGQGFAQLESAGITVSHGFLLEEAEQLNEVYFHYMRTQRPFVHIKAGLSMDGRIATATGKSQWITGEEARRYAHSLRQRYDAILVGRRTLEIDDPRLDVRIEGGGSIHRIILDSRLSISPDAQIFSREAGGEVLIAAIAGDSKKISELENSGASVLICKARDGRVDLDDLLKQLGERGITSLMVEGGGETIASILNDGLANKITFVYAPLIIGGRKSVPVVSGKEIDELGSAYRLRGLRSFQLGEDIAIEGYPR